MEESTKRARHGLIPDLSKVAAVARRALAADAVLIASRSGGRALSWIGVAGIDEKQRRTVGGALARIDCELQDTPVFHAVSLRETGAPYAAALLEEGFGSALCAKVELDGAHAGAIYALRRDEGAFADEELIQVFARHAAVTVAHHRLWRRTAMLAERLEDRVALDQLVLSVDDFDDLSRRLKQLLAPRFRAGLTGIMMWNEERQVLQLMDGSFDAPPELVASYQISDSDAHSNAARVFATGRPYLSNDARGDPGILQDYVAAFGIENTLSLPLRVGDKTIGVVHFANKATDFTVEDLHRAEMLAPRIATVVELARTMFASRRQQRMEGILSRLAVAIASGESIQDFLRPALEDLCTAMQTNLIALVVGDSAPILARRGTKDIDRETQLLAAARRTSATASTVSKPLAPGDPGSATVHIPVRFGSQRVGSVAALRLRGEPFVGAELEALERLGSLAALAYASERYQQQRAKLARLEERERIADDLHDDVAQILFVAQLALDTTLEQPQLAPEVAELVLRARRLLVKGDAAIRSLIQQLSRPAASDFPDRLGDVVGTVEEAYGLPIHLEITDAASTVARLVPEPVADALTKVAREALVNAGKHAGPCRVSMTLDLDPEDRLRLSVVDDGLGLDEGYGGDHHGLASMRRSIERHGGTLTVRGGSAGGSKIVAIVPA